MLDPYRRLLTLPGALLFSLTGLVARLPISMLGLGIVLLVSQQSGSYGLAGTVSASTVIAGAIGAPVQGRLTDRFGQSVVLPLASSVSALGLSVMLIAIRLDWAPPLPHLFAAVAGVALPQVGSMVRARWSFAIPDRTALQTAFAFEAVVDEAVFIVGPVLVTFLATLLNPYVGLLFAGACGLVGSVFLAAQRRTEPVVSGHDHTRAGRRPLGWNLLGPLVVAAVGLGALFGASEVVAVAYATSIGHRAASGALLATWAAGSMVAGIMIGARPPSIATLTQLRIATTLLTLSFVPLLFTHSLPLVALCLLVSGLAISPSLVASISLVERAVPKERLTEGISWVTTGLAAGVAPGAAISGWVVDHHGSTTGFAVSMLAGGLAAAVAWAIRPRSTFQSV